MIAVTVNVPIPALNTVAVDADVHEFSGGVYTYDLFDASGTMVAESRYSDPATAPFTLSIVEQLSITV